MFPSNHSSRVRTLYKLIFRVHRSLPEQLRVLGDIYARDEFKRHKKCNAPEAKIFLMEWMEYAINLANQVKPAQYISKTNIGKNLDLKALDLMRDEQIMQLYELRKAALNEEYDQDKTNS